MQNQAMSNPIMKQAYEMTNGKSPQEIMQIAQNLANSQGVNLQELQQKLGL
jgi:hypothetical protein